MHADAGSPSWRTTVSAMLRPPLMTRGGTLRGITASLDAYQADGFDAVEVFAPCAGGTCYGGLDTLDYYQIDPAIGTVDEFARLVTEAQARQWRSSILAMVTSNSQHSSRP